MKTQLRNIAGIQTGFFAKPCDSGDLVYLQSKHFDEYGQLNSELYPDLPAEGIADKHLLKDGDVLFAAKGTKNFAVVYECHNEPAVASTSFFVIRLNEKRVLPGFLVWFLNNQIILKFLKSQAIGTSIPSISKQVIENLEISVPDIETQKAIVEISSLRNKEKSLKRQIEKLRDKQIQQQILNTIN